MRQRRWLAVVAVGVVVIHGRQALAQGALTDPAAAVCTEAAAEDVFNVKLPVPPPMPVACRLDQACLVVDWNIASQQDLTDILKLHRLNEKTPLRIHTTNVNLLQFKVTWTQTVQQQIEGFEGAAKLLEGFAPILSLVTGAPSALFESDGPSQRALAKWLKAIELANSCLQATTGSVTDVVIDRQGSAKRQRLHETHAIVSAALPKLTELKNAFLKEITASDELTNDEIETYTKMSQRNDDFQKRATEFLPLARKAVDGVTSVMSTEKRNSVVALTGQASKRDGEKVGDAVSATYFVAWSRPVTYHVGYGYGRLKTFDFKQVRTLSGQDLFAATKPADAEQAGDTSDDSAEPEPVAFLTWELFRRGPNNRYGVGFTAGTGLQSAGDSIYYGGTVRVFSRLLLTFGAVSARAERGEGQVIDTTTDAGETRTLFSALKESTATKPFWSISFKVY